MGPTLECTVSFARARTLFARLGSAVCVQRHRVLRRAVSGRPQRQLQNRCLPLLLLVGKQAPAVPGQLLPRDPGPACSERVSAPSPCPHPSHKTQPGGGHAVRPMSPSRLSRLLRCWPLSLPRVQPVTFQIQICHLPTDTLSLFWHTWAGVRLPPRAGLWSLGAGGHPAPSRCTPVLPSLVSGCWCPSAQSRGTRGPMCDAVVTSAPPLLLT